ncbi:MAG: tRNA (guanosine(37)-N1)-methyltransferase TrmD [Fidelibacterota bacterium]|nr:MAG: tRNA (guanosine(37)-N1)-methyltransferase TrmD [Candidatus Neomarinimicrobiota bacterium]
MSLRIDIITPFPKLVEEVVTTSILGRASDKGRVSYVLHNLYEFADPPHNKIDDEPYGGGVGMILKPEPVFRAFDRVLEQSSESAAGPRIIFPTPDGKPFTQADAEELAQSEQLVFICGHYKGIDQRIRDELVTDEYSIGDFVVSGGELPALLILDAIVRLQVGVLSSMESAETDSFSSDLLDGPHYTRPREFRGLAVPEILLSGHHGEITNWRLERRRDQTRKRRPDLWRKQMKIERQALEQDDG